MSLTSFTGQSKELKEKFKTALRRPAFGLKHPLLAPPISQNYSIVGQAFDYLLRFYLERRLPKLIMHTPDWVANLSLNYIMSTYQPKKTREIWIGRMHDVKVNRVKFLDMLTENYLIAEDEYKTFLLSGKITDQLLESCLFLARLDVTVRAGMIDPKLGNEIQDDIADLQALYGLIREEHFAAQERILLNPTFIGGSLVGGADTDLVLDNALIDIKTTKNLELDRKDLNQIIGYYFLSRIGGFHGDKTGKPIQELGIYFSRFGIMYKFQVSELGDESDLENCKKWFFDHANQLFHGGRYLVIKRKLEKAKALQQKKKSKNKSTDRLTPQKKTISKSKGKNGRK